MKQVHVFIFTIAFTLLCNYSHAQNSDTVSISAPTLYSKNIPYGKIDYLVYNKQAKDSPAQGLYLVQIQMERILYKGQPAIAISQQWDGRDTVLHRAYTVLSATDFSTRLHQTSWKGLGYSSRFDFDDRTVIFEGKIADSNKTKIISAFDASFAGYNLNWHTDLFIFTRLPYRENRSFRIQFYDPGFGKPSEEIYSVTGSDVLRTDAGKKINCWVMEHTGKAAGSYQKFWIDKKTRLVLKEEDLFNNRYRFKRKLQVAENG